MGSSRSVLSVSALDNATVRVASDFNSIRYSPYSPVRRVVFSVLWTLKWCFAALNLDAAATSGPSELYGPSRKRGELQSAPNLTRESRRFRCRRDLQGDREAGADTYGSGHFIPDFCLRIRRGFRRSVSLSELMSRRSFPDLAKRTRRRDGGG